MLRQNFLSITDNASSPLFFSTSFFSSSTFSFLSFLVQREREKEGISFEVSLEINKLCRVIGNAERENCAGGHVLASPPSMIVLSR